MTYLRLENIIYRSKVTPIDNISKARDYYIQVRGHFMDNIM